MAQLNDKESITVTREQVIDDVFPVSGTWVLNVSPTYSSGGPECICGPTCSYSFMGQSGTYNYSIFQDGASFYSGSGQFDTINGTIDGNSITWSIAKYSDDGCHDYVDFKGEINGTQIIGGYSGHDDADNCKWGGDFIVNIRLPVLLVHGFCSNAGMWGSGSWPFDGSFDFKQELINKGFVVETIDLCPKPTKDNIWNYGSQLNDMITSMKEQNQVGQINMVAHSLGGLAARAYAIQNIKKRDVNTLIMLGTPNNGADILREKYRRIAEIFFSCLQNSEAADQMTPGSPFLKTLNQNNVLPSPSISNYYSIAGVIDGVEPGDGIVEQSSIHSLPYATHIDVAVSHSHYDDSDQVLMHVVNILDGDFSSSSFPIDIQQENAHHQEAPLIESSLSDGSNQHIIPIDSTVSEAYFILASDAEGLDFTLTTPEGNLITPTIAAQDSLIKYTNEITTLMSYNIINPGSGNWTANVAVSGTVASEVSYAVLAIFDSDLKLSVFQDETIYPNNASIPLMSQLVNSNIPIIGAIVTAQVKHPNGNSSVLTLYDNGLLGDAQANDGIYSTSFESTNLPGRYDITFTASGTINDEQFVRDTPTTIWVDSTTWGDYSILLPLIMK